MRVRRMKRGVFAMKCPYCGYQESKVVDSRHSDDGGEHSPPPRMPAMPEAVYHL